MKDAESVIYRLALALAEADGANVGQLDYTLTEYIDPSWLDGLVSNGSASGEFTFEVPDHEVTVRDTGDIYVDGILYESDRAGISERRGVASLREEQRQFWKGLESMPCFVYRCGNQRERPMYFVSDGFQAQTGYEPDALTAGSISYGLDVVHPADHDTTWDTIQQSVQNGTPFSLIYCIETADNTTKRVIDSGVGLPGDSEPPSIVGIVVECPDSETQRESEPAGR